MRSFGYIKLRFSFFSIIIVRIVHRPELGNTPALLLVFIVQLIEELDAFFEKTLGV